MIEPLIMKKSPDFPSGMPPLGPGLIPVRAESPYLMKIIRDLRETSAYPLSEVMLVEKKYKDVLTGALSTFSPLFTDYDNEIILPTTCALGYKRASHQELEERGKSGEGSDFVMPYAFVKACAEYVMRFKKEDDWKNFSMSLPRQTAMGYPHKYRAVSRDTNLQLLSLHVASAMGAKQKGISLADLTKVYERFYGPCIITPGSRFQHTKNTMIMPTSAGIYYTKNFEPRRRLILAGPKFMIVYNREVTKRALNVLKNSPHHNQDRSYIQTKISGWVNDSSMEVYAADHSKFDNRHGLPRSENFLRAICDIIAGMPQAFEHIMTEFTTPHFLWYANAAYTVDHTSILKSGISPTTVLGIFAGFCATVYAFHLALNKPVDFILSQFDQGNLGCLSWGDDTVLAWKKTLTTKEKVEAGFAAQKLKVEEEPSIRYLGHLYDNGPFKGSMKKGYPIGRAVQQTFFPERKKDFPFSAIGYIARLQLVGDQGAAFHELMSKSKFWDESLYGPKFAFKDRMAVLKGLVPLVEKHAIKINQMDDILQSLTHGLSDMGVDALDGQFAEFGEFLGMSLIDVSDPVKVAADTNPKSKYLLNYLEKLMKGDVLAIDAATREIAFSNGLAYTKGSVQY
jgi:hypothetical protein